MKKKFMLVSAMVIMAMSAMFVACNEKNQNNPSEPAEESKPENGCICTVTDKEGQKETYRVEFNDMVDYYQATTCSELSTAYKDYIAASSKVSCKGY